MSDGQSDISRRKKCIHCKEIKEITEFKKNPKCTSGIGNVCKKCDTRMRAHKPQSVKSYVNQVTYFLTDRDY